MPHGRGGVLSRVPDPLPGCSTSPGSSQGLHGGEGYLVLRTQARDARVEEWDGLLLTLEQVKSSLCVCTRACACVYECVCR